MYGSSHNRNNVQTVSIWHVINEAHAKAFKRIRSLNQNTYYVINIIVFDILLPLFLFARQQNHYIANGLNWKEILFISDMVWFFKLIKIDM